MEKVEQHRALCDELNALYARKNHDYGDSFHLSFVEEGLAMPRIRLGDKFNRFKTLSRSVAQEVPDESLRDTLMDLANYALMTVLELDDAKQIKSPDDETVKSFRPDPCTVFSRKGHPMMP